MCITAWVKGIQTKFNKFKQIKTKLNIIEQEESNKLKGQTERVKVKHELVQLNQARQSQKEQNRIKKNQREPNRFKLSQKESM